MSAHSFEWILTLCFAENAVYLCAAGWADALCHTTTRVGDLDGSFELTLLFALHAVSLTLVCLCHFFLLSSLGHAGISHKARSNTLTIPREARITRSFRTRGMVFLRSIERSYAWAPHSYPSRKAQARSLSPNRSSRSWKSAPWSGIRKWMSSWRRM